jgi:hypothetical protein
MTKKMEREEFIESMMAAREQEQDQEQDQKPEVVKVQTKAIKPAKVQKPKPKKRKSSTMMYDALENATAEVMKLIEEAEKTMSRTERLKSQVAALTRSMEANIEAVDEIIEHSRKELAKLVMIMGVIADETDI